MFTTIDNGLGLYFEDEGRGMVVVLVHGLRCSSVTWRHQIPALSSKFRVIAPDLRGHGQTDKPAGPYAVDDWINDLKQLLDRLELSRVVLIGHSLGGGVVQAFTFAHPNRVAALGLIATSPERTARVSEALLRSALIAEREGRLPPAEATLRARVGRGFAEAHPEEMRIEAASMGDDARAYAAACVANSARKGWTLRLPEVSVPVIYVAGDQDRADTARNAELYRQHLPDVETHILPGVGHMVPMEAPGRLNPLLLAFLERLRDGVDS